MLSRKAVEQQTSRTCRPLLQNLFSPSIVAALMVSCFAYWVGVRPPKGFFGLLTLYSSRQVSITARVAYSPSATMPPDSETRAIYRDRTLT